MDFYLGGTLVGTDATEPYSLVVTNAPAGHQSPGGRRARQRRADGHLRHRAMCWWPTWGVTIISPADGAIYQNTNPITVSAFALLPSGTMTNVEFFVDGEKFGEDGTRALQRGVEQRQRAARTG